MSDNKLVNVEMSHEDLEAFRKFKEDQEKTKLFQEKLDNYRNLVNKTVNDTFSNLSMISDQMKGAKLKLMQEFTTLIELKSELFSINSNQKSHSFLNSDNTIRVTIGYHYKDDYQDTVNEGIELIKESISELAIDDNSKILVDAVMTLISKDKYGGISAQKLMQLKKFSSKISNEKFIKGVNIIEESYELTKTKSFIYVDKKNSQGKWEKLSLSLTDL